MDHGKIALISILWEYSHSLVVLCYSLVDIVYSVTQLVFGDSVAFMCLVSSFRFQDFKRVVCLNNFQ